MAIVFVQHCLKRPVEFGGRQLLLIFIAILRFMVFEGFDSFFCTKISEQESIGILSNSYS